MKACPFAIRHRQMIDRQIQLSQGASLLLVVRPGASPSLSHLTRLAAASRANTDLVYLLLRLQL
jgi:hypothetical protein